MIRSKIASRLNEPRRVRWPSRFDVPVMENKKPTSPGMEPFSSAKERTGGSKLRAVATKDHDVIRQWADRHSAEPATGESTASGSATVHVVDGGAGIRFNFPGFSRFRTITWTEWFDNFDRHQLTFVYEEDVPDRAYDFWQARGGGDGHDREDWLQAEQELGTAAFSGARYRLVKEPETSE